MDPKTIYQAMVAIDGVRSYMYVRADNISQAFDCALIGANARNPQSAVEVIAAQELREPVDVHIIWPVDVFLTPIEPTKSIPAMSASTAAESQAPVTAVISSK
jgi:hypothetical protein